MKSALYVGASLAFFSLAGSSFATKVAAKEEQPLFLASIGFEYTYHIEESLPLLYLNMVLSNQYSRVIADIYVTCTTYSESQQMLEHVHYLYQEYMAVGETVQLERVSLGLVDDRTYNVSCAVVDAASMPVG